MAERFRVGLLETAFPFIPPADKFLEYLGRPGGMAAIINELGVRLDKPLPDPKTVRKAVKGGVTPRSGEKIKEVLESIATPEMYEYLTSSYLAPWMETSFSNNGLAWLCMIKGEHLRLFETDHPETFTEKFLKRRAEQERGLLETAREIQKQGATESAIEELWWKTLSPFLRETTLVGDSHIDTGLQAAADFKSSTGQSRGKKAGLLLGLYARIRIDFYYHLLCNASLDVIQWCEENGTLDSHGRHWLVENSFVGDMVPTFDGEAMNLPFERLLDAWRGRITKDGSKLPWVEVADRLPNPYGLDAHQSRAPHQTVEERKEDIRRNKKSRLREWRNGTRPTAEQLQQFIRNLIPEDENVPMALTRAEIAATWGAFILDEWKTFEACGLNDALCQTLPAFERFPVYWAGYKAQAAQILAA